MRKLLKKVYHELLWILPRKLGHKIVYYRFLKKKLDFNNVKDFNEKIQWLIINKYGKKEANLADKYKVKEYVNKLNIDSLNIPKTLQVYRSVDEINLDELPENFVLKCNHGSGNSFICNDKKSFDFETCKKVLKKSMKENFAKYCLEYHYGLIEPVIIAEEYLKDSHGKNPVDYKFYVFNGNVDRILVCSEREKKLKLMNFDTKWNILDDVVEKYKPNNIIEKPKNLNTMVDIAEKLVKDESGNVVIPFCRVDLYNIDGKIYFGEYTFTPAAGVIYYYNQKCLDELGEKIDLNQYK